MTPAHPFIDLTRRDYRVIYADPPWRFASWSHRGEDRGAVQHYPCMGIDELSAMPVVDLVGRDAVMFMWVVQPMLPEAMDLIKAWGFHYKTVGYYWFKIKGGQDRLFYDAIDIKKGLGYHTRSGCEQRWIATRGKGYERLSQNEPQVVFAPLREHSRKPDEIAESIVRLVGDVPRVELFSRRTRPGWDVWGNQVGKFDEVPA